MLFFKSLAVLSTLAFGALSALGAPAASAVENGLVARCDCKSMPSIMTGLKKDVKGHVEELLALTADTCVEANVGPIVAELKVIVSNAVVDVKALAGQPLDVIVGANVDVHVLASIVADVVVYILAAVRVALNVCVGANVSVCIALFASLCEVLAALVFAVITVCANVFVGLDVAIYALLKVCADVILKVHASLFISMCGL